MQLIGFFASMQLLCSIVIKIHLGKVHVKLKENSSTCTLCSVIWFESRVDRMIITPTKDGGLVQRSGGCICEYCLGQEADACYVLLVFPLDRDPGVITSAIENTGEALASSPSKGREGQDWHPAHAVWGQEPRIKPSSLICDPVRWRNNFDLIKPSLCHISPPNDRIICKAKEMVSKRFLFSCLSKEERTFLYQKIGQNATRLKVLIDSSWWIKDLLGDKG